MALCAGPGKNEWAELVGASGDEAEARIQKETAGAVDAIVVLEGTIVTHDYRCNRVWVWVNHHRIVTRVPRLG